MPIIRRWLKESLKTGRTTGKEQSYDHVRSAHNPEMDGDKQPKVALGNTHGRSTRIQKNTEGKAAVRETQLKSAKLSYGKKK